MDASGECRKARWLLGRKYPHIVVLDCYRHQVCSIDYDTGTNLQHIQVNLVVGDYFRLPIDVLQYMDIANKLITWLQSKTIVLALLRKAQLDTRVTALAVIRAVLTWWTAHYRAYNTYLNFKERCKCLYLQKMLSLIRRN